MHDHIRSRIITGGSIDFAVIELRATSAGRANVVAADPVPSEAQPSLDSDILAPLLPAAFDVDPTLLQAQTSAEVTQPHFNIDAGSSTYASTSSFAAPNGVVESAVSIVDGGSVEIGGAGTQSVAFLGSTGTLKIDHSLAFTGTIAGLLGEDAIDFADINFGAQTKVTFLGDHDGGTLTVTDGINTANISLQGDYLSSTWTMSSDVNGGTIVVDPVASGTWETLKVGAGGWVRNLDIASDGTMVGRTDTYGAYIWNGSQWVQLVTANSLPSAFVSANQNNQTLGQGVYEIQISNSNTQVLYMMYDGYVFKSTNRGTTWTQTSFAQVNANPNDSYAQYGQKMAVDPSNSNIVYVGTPSNGLWVTKDGGATWRQVSQVPSAKDPSGFTGILFDPAVGGVVGGVTQTIFAESNGNGVYLSTNGGASWKLLTGGPTTVVNAAVSSTGAYFATDGQNLWRYSGGAWTQLSTGMSGAGIQSVAVNPNNANEVIAVSPAGYLSVSYNGGTSWSGVDWSSNGVSSKDIPWLQAGNTATSGNFLCVGGVVFNPLVPNQIIASAGTGVWNATVPTTGLAWNTPVTWNDQSLGIEQLVANQIIVPTGGHPVLASWDRPFFYVSDVNSYPLTYGPVASVNIDAGWSVDYASSNTNFVTGLLNYGKAVYSTDGGQTWKNFASLPTFPSQANGGTIAASTPQNVILAPANGVQPYYTLDGGATWKAITLPGITNWSTFEGASYLDERSITADRVLANTFYLYYAGHGVYRSTDGGASWTQVYNGNDGFGSQWNGYISPFTTFNNELMSVPGEASNLFFTGGNQSGYMPNYPFMRSTDGGTTWKPVANVLDVTCFGFGAPATPGGYPAVYIVGYVNNVYGIWQSIDNAQSWTQIGTYPNSSLDNIKTIAGDPSIFGQVYVGFMGSGYAVLTASSSTPTHITSVSESPSTGNLNTGNTVTLTLSLSSAVTVAGGTPTLTLNDGGVATYTGGSGTGVLTFKYTVAAGQNTSDLAVTAINLNSATVKDSAGKAANLAGAVTNPSGTLQIDTTAPTVSSVMASGTGITSGNGNLATGGVVTLTLNLSEAVTVAGGTPTLTLNDGGVATYTGGSGTGALTFKYTVAAGQSTSDLAVKAINLNSATVKDGGGNAANLTGAVTNPSGTLRIDTSGTTLIEALGSTRLTQVGKNYFLSNGAGSGTELQRNGLAVVDAQFGAWAPIGAEATSSGYDVAWKVAGVDRYTVWKTDIAGNYLSNFTGVVSGRSSVLETLEPIFHQDLNGDGTVGPVRAAIETKGVTRLTQVGDNYNLDNASGSGPILKRNGVAVVSGQFGAWTPIGAEATSSGYDVAWKVAGVDRYIVWKTDIAGNYLSDLTGIVSGQARSLETLERYFHQDLNGDGAIGLVTKVLDAQGTTRLTQIGNNYFLLNNAGAGPELQRDGIAVVTNQFGSWLPIGSEASSGGYELAWKSQGRDLYSIWNLDTKGNFVSQPYSNLSGSSGVTESLESKFQQDLNGDGVVAIAAGQTMELTGPFTETITFDGPTGTLKIDNSAAFNGVVGGKLTTNDAIDLADISAGADAKLAYSGDRTTGTLTVSDGTHKAEIKLVGDYTLSNFTASNDGWGGTLIVDPPSVSADSTTWLETVDQKLALFSQHVASTWPSSSFHDSVSSATHASNPANNSGLQFATPLQNQCSAGSMHE